MRQAVMAGLVVAMVLLVSGARAGGEGTVQLENSDQRMSYSLGLQIGEHLKRLGMSVDLKAFNAGVADKYEGRKVQLTDEELNALQKELIAHMRRQQEEARKKRASEGTQNLKQESMFLEKNAKADGVVTTESGLQYKVLKKGDGAKPEATDWVKVHYRGTLLNGDEFDSSYKTDKPVEFPLNGVIAGWTEALQLMPVGSKYKLFIPSALAYGSNGRPGIPPNSMLIFEVELLSIRDK